MGVGVFVMTSFGERWLMINGIIVEGLDLTLVVWTIVWPQYFWGWFGSLRWNSVVSVRRKKKKKKNDDDVVSL